MSKKSNRLPIIEDLIRSQAVSSQEELMEKLRQTGVEATQSTLSRDMKELGAVKVPHPEKGYVYMLPSALQGSAGMDRAAGLIPDSIRSVTFSGNLIVIKTVPGYANAITVVIDDEQYPFIAGTVAGDDTIFVALTEDADRREVIRHFLRRYPGMADLL